MSSLQIAILGMLCEEECHPYEIKKKILRFSDNIFTVTDGALYYSFDSLMKKGFIKQTEVVHSDNRPDKTMYAITGKGIEGLKTEIYKMYKKHTDIKSLIGTIPFLHLVDKDKITSYIAHTLQKLNERIEFIERNRVHLPDLSTRIQLEFLADYSEQSMQLEVEWFTKLLKIIDSLD